MKYKNYQSKCQFKIWQNVTLYLVMDERTKTSEVSENR